MHRDEGDLESAALDLMSEIGVGIGGFAAGQAGVVGRLGIARQGGYAPASCRRAFSKG